MRAGEISHLHLPRAYLYLQRLASGPNDLRVQRLVHVGFALGDVVRETVRDRYPQLVHDAKHVVALSDGFHDDPKG